MLNDLLRPSQLKEEIESLKNKREALRTLATRMVPDFHELPSGGGEAHSAEKLLVKIADMSTEIEEKEKLLNEISEELALMFIELPDGNQTQVMCSRYIFCDSWQQMENRIGISKRYCRDIHAKALHELSHPGK